MAKVNNSFFLKLTKKWQQNKFVCIGLDSDYSKIPNFFKNGKSLESVIFTFNKSITDQTFNLVCCYKINAAFYEAEGIDGWKALKKTIQYIHQKYPDIPVIVDAKFGDIGNTNEGYTKAVFEDLGADAVTVHPYHGRQAMQPFLERKDRGIFVLVRTSNPGAEEFQELKVGGNQIPLYQIIAQNIAKHWNKNDNLGIVVGANFPSQLRQVRKIVGDMPILIPGVGAQGGDVKATVKAGINSKGQGIIISSSRAIIFADNPREATLKLHQEITKALKK